MPPFPALARGLADRLDDPIRGPWVDAMFGPGATVRRLDAMVPAICWIRARTGRLSMLKPNEAQKRFTRNRSHRNIILKARQLGMTTWIAARFFLATILRPGTVTLQVAHSLESAQQIFRIVHRFLHALDYEVGPHVSTERANVRELSFARIDSRYIVDTAGNPHAGRGLTVQNLHASEVALWPHDPAETMAALVAAVVPGGTIEIESTPHGAGGYFHGEWLRATEGRGGPTAFTPHFFPWWLEPEYTLPLAPGETVAPLAEDERRLSKSEKLSPEQILFRRHLQSTFADRAPQEYAEDPASCFLASGRPAFELAAIEQRLAELHPPISVRENGAELGWFEPAPNREYVIGADVAEGLDRGDFSAAVVLDRASGLQCAELLARWPIDRFAEALAALGRRYNGALIAVERNNHGHAVLLALSREHAYPNLYAHPSGAPAAAQRDRPGWPMNAQTKPLAVEMLRKMLRDAPRAFQSRRLLEQCRSFVYHDNGQTGALPGAHDDLVIAVAIALAVRELAIQPKLLHLEL
jgi:hypothetical protein